MQKFICACLLATLVHASHFRGAIFSWKPVNNNTIDIFIRMSWRRSSSGPGGDLECDANDVQSQSKVHWGGVLVCNVGCLGSVVTFPGVLSCTDFSVSEDWSTLAGNYIYSTGLNTKFSAMFAGSDWIHLSVGGGAWSVLVSVDIKTRSDIGKINSSPVTAMPPLVKLRHGCANIINITVDDADQDVVRCRWSVASNLECGGVCSAFPGTILDQAACSLSVPSSVPAGLYAVAVMIEDFAPADTTFSTPLSKIPLQFLVNLAKSNVPCSVEAVFSSSTRIAGSCISIPLNMTFTESVISRLLINGVPQKQTDLKTVSPIGLITSTPRLVAGSTGEWSVTITWTPTPAQIGPHVFCFQGEFDLASTEQRCVTFLVGVSAPKPIMVASYKPTGRVSVDEHTWTIEYDKPIVKQHDTRYIYFHEVGVSAYVGRVGASSSAVSIPNGSNAPYILKIVTSFTLSAPTSYYILLDPGVVKGTEGCGTESHRLSNKSAWTFFTAKGDPDIVLCNPLLFKHGHYLFSHKSNCNAYLQCSGPGQSYPIVRFCDWNYFWNALTAACERAGSTLCPHDPCGNPSVTAYAHETLCSAFWTCAKKRTVGAKCCPLGQSWVAGSCATNSNCTDLCPPVFTTERPCDLKTYTGDITKYWQEISPGIWDKRDCAPGTAFVKSDCKCSGEATVVPSVCEHELYAPFDYNHKDYKQRVYVERGRGMKAGQRDMPGYVGTGAAFFSGTNNSFLCIIRWTNSHFGTELMIKFLFAEDQSVIPNGVLESLVTNGRCGVQPSVGLMLDRANSLVTAVIVTDTSGAKSISVSYAGSGWKDVEYVYNGSVLSLKVNGNNNTVIVRGPITPSSWALLVGSGCGLRHYKGHMDELYVYDSCLPN